MADAVPRGQDTPFSGTGPFGQLPVEVVVSVGRARPLIGDLLRLGQDTVLPLDRRVDDPVELYVGGRLIGRGELTIVDGDPAGHLAVRLTEIAGQQDGG